MAEAAVRSSAKRTREIFAADFASPLSLDHASNPSFSIHPTTPAPSTAADQINVASRIRNEYEHVRELPPALAAKMASAASTAAERRKKIKAQNAEEKASDPKMQRMIDGASEKAEKARDVQSMQLTLRAGGKGAAPNAQGPTPNRNQTSSALVRKDVVRQAKPDWHAPWKVSRVMAGHMGWVRSLAMDPDNQFVASGAGDRTIKIWDLASGQLKLTLTGHISAVRGLAVSPRHPYLFSCGEDKMVKCWDLETNKVIRHYHGHLSGVYSLSLHPTVDVLCTGGRDGVVRVWDMRTRTNIAPGTNNINSATSVFGRTVLPYFADTIGSFNIVTMSAGMSGICMLALWLPFNYYASHAGIIVFGLAYGFFSGAFVSLLMPCVAKAGNIQSLGRRFGTFQMVMAIR